MLRWKVNPVDGGSEVFLDGDVAEDTDLTGLKPRGPRVVLDAAKVGHINSEGLRRLVNWLRSLGADDRAVEAKRCSPVLVEQLNLVPELGRLMKVRSLFLPLECSQCLGESVVLVDLPAAGRPPVPTHKCKKCGIAMDLAEPADRYFAFLE